MRQSYTWRSTNTGRGASPGRPRSTFASTNLPAIVPPQKSQAFQELRTRRSQATFQEDLEAMREANTALVVRTLESYARHNAELDEHGDGPT